MELLDVYGNVGQQFGFIVYQTLIDIPSEGAVLTIMGRARDSAQVCKQ